MRLITRHRAGGLAAFIGCFVVVWSAHGDQDVVAAQHRTPITVTRMFTGPDGQTHVEDIDVRLMPRAGVEGSELSEAVKVTSLQFQRTTPGYFRDWHPVAQRQYLVVLSGHREIEIAGGKKIVLEPGRIVLAEDVTGKGHQGRGVGTEDAISLIIPLGK
jgi:hypothetical protein